MVGSLNRFKWKDLKIDGANRGLLLESPGRSSVERNRAAGTVTVRRGM